MRRPTRRGARKSRVPRWIGWIGAVAAALLACAVAWYGSPDGDGAPPCHDKEPTACAQLSPPCTKSAQLERCPATCGLCTDGCKRLNATPSIGPGGLVPLFERMATRDEYAPRWLSRDPPMLAFDAFLSTHETARLRSHCHIYKRSLAGDAVSSVRTSKQCWCNTPDCLRDPVIRRVLDRVHALTETDPDVAEFLQIVRYEPGQFYQLHHDQNSSPLAPQGPRTLTFFMYLNTPDEGGSTSFPSLDLRVEPIEGRAVVWSSVDADAVKEPRTLHEALPVTRGVKFGANLWLHLYDWKGVSRRGCSLLHHMTDT